MLHTSFSFSRLCFLPAKWHSVSGKMSLLLATEMIHKLGKVIKSDVLIRAWWLLTHCVSAVPELPTCHCQGQQEYLHSPWSCVRQRLAGPLGALPSSKRSRFLGVHHLPVSIFSPPPCISLPASIPAFSHLMITAQVLWSRAPVLQVYFAFWFSWKITSTSNNLVPSTDCRQFSRFVWFLSGGVY